MAIELPRRHAFMHLDTVMSMVDRSTFVLYPYSTGAFRLDHHRWTLWAGLR